MREGKFRLIQAGNTKDVRWLKAEGWIITITITLFNANANDNANLF